MHRTAFQPDAAPPIGLNGQPPRRRPSGRGPPRSVHHEVPAMPWLCLSPPLQVSTPMRWAHRNCTITPTTDRKHVPSSTSGERRHEAKRTNRLKDKAAVKRDICHAQLLTGMTPLPKSGTCGLAIEPSPETLRRQIVPHASPRRICAQHPKTGPGRAFFRDSRREDSRL